MTVHSIEKALASTPASADFMPLSVTFIRERLFTASENVTASLPIAIALMLLSYTLALRFVLECP